MSDEIIKSMFPSSPGMLITKPDPGPDTATREAFPVMLGPTERPPSPERREPTSPPGEKLAPPPEDLHTRAAAWEQEARADPVFGGEKFEATIASARSVVARYGDQELKDALNQSGLGNHPALIRLLAKVAAGR